MTKTLRHLVLYTPLKDLIYEDVYKSMFHKSIHFYIPKWQNANTATSASEKPNFPKLQIRSTPQFSGIFIFHFIN
jgi:hypothetical protein